MRVPPSICLKPQNRGGRMKESVGARGDGACLAVLKPPAPPDGSGNVGKKKRHAEQRVFPFGGDTRI